MRNMEGRYLFVLPFQVLLEYSDVRAQNLVEVRWFAIAFI